MVIKYPKSQLTPAQIIEFLDFIIDSRIMELKLSGETIKAETGCLLSQTDNNASTLSRFIGKLNDVTQAVALAPCFTEPKNT